MKDLKQYISEQLEVVNVPENNVSEAEDTVKNEKDFREYAKNKFKEAFGEELDEDKMNETIDGILKDHKDDADKGDWGKLVGILNKSFGEK